MLVDCPECGASSEGASGAEMVCPACMTPFLVPASARAVRAFDVQAGGDAVIQRMSRYAVREAIYLGRLTASARVRHGGGRWELIGGYPEFASVFRLLGGDLAPMAGTRKLAGWRRAPGAPEPSSPRNPRPAEPTPTPYRPAETTVPVARPAALESRRAAAAEPVEPIAALAAAEAPPTVVSGGAFDGGGYLAPPPVRRGPEDRVPVKVVAPAPPSNSRVYLLGGALVAVALLAWLLW